MRHEFTYLLRYLGINIFIVAQIDFILNIQKDRVLSIYLLYLFFYWDIIVAILIIDF